MRILVIGLDCAAPELLFGDERLNNFRRLMDAGSFGRLESVVPPITVPAWMCLSTGQDPGTLGVYGFRNRSDHSYEGLRVVNSRSIDAVAMWDQLAREGKKSYVIGVPPNFPPRKVNGVSVGCFLTPDTTKDVFTHPAEAGDEIRKLVGYYPVDVKGFRTDDKAPLLADIHAMTRAHFEVIRHYMRRDDWDLFQFVEIGLDRIQHGFWRFHDPGHVRHEPNSPYGDAIRDYYRVLDEEVGSLLELLDEETIVLVVSDHGARKLDGGFCVNEWLIREGLLTLHSYPKTVTPFAKLDVDWDRTVAWSEGGYYARVFLNVKGREPRGIIEKNDVLRVRDDLKARLEATTDPEGNPLGTLVFRPEEIYRSIRNVAPDLIVHFGALAWRSVGGVGYPTIHVQENDTGPDDCNHSQHGAFILAGPNVPVSGEVEGAHLLDIAPTLLELGGYDVPPSMRGAIDSAGLIRPAGAVSSGYSPEGEDLVRERLSGLGYI
ncbi:MAG: alkaline phosphatase family protein [Isosphaeraceae bacterium]